MAKKKRKESDFQKTKLKVGRKLLRGTNDTKTEFKSKKIVVKEMESRFKDPIKTLTNGFGINYQTKVFCLNNVDKWLTPINIKSKSGEVVTTVSKYLNDSDPRVRTESIKCLKHCIYLLHKNDEKSVSPLMPIILTYINCGLTHIDSHITNDSLKLLSHLIDFSDKSLFNQLMQTINTLITNKSKIESNVFEVCHKLVSQMYRNDSKSVVSKDCPVMVWSANDFYCDIHSVISQEKSSLEINLSFQTSSSIDIKEKFFKTLENIVRNELKVLLLKDSNTLSISEARKAIYVIKIASIIELSININQDLNFNITAINTNEKTNNKQKQLISNLYNELNASINKLLDKSKSNQLL